MSKKTELSKLERKRLERELIRNHRQRKENKREMNRLNSLYPAYNMLRRKQVRFFCYEEEEESMQVVGRSHGEAVRGILS